MSKLTREDKEQLFAEEIEHAEKHLRRARELLDELNNELFCVTQNKNTTGGK